MFVAIVEKAIEYLATSPSDGYIIDFKMPKMNGIEFYKHLCTKISNKNQESYTDVMNWVRCKISFMCLKAAIMCVRGTRVSKSNMKVDYISNDFKFDVNEANMNR